MKLTEAKLKQMIREAMADNRIASGAKPPVKKSSKSVFDQVRDEAGAKKRKYAKYDKPMEIDPKTGMYFGEQQELEEVNYAPEYPSEITDEQIEKIHAAIDRGDLEQAQSFIDAFKGDPDYVQKYIEYGRPMEFERLGQSASDMFKPRDSAEINYRVLKPEYDFDDVGKFNDEAYKLAKQRAKEMLPPDASGYEIEDKAQEIYGTRYSPVRSGPPFDPDKK